MDVMSLWLKGHLTLTWTCVFPFPCLYMWGSHAQHKEPNGEGSESMSNVTQAQDKRDQDLTAESGFPPPQARYTVIWENKHSSVVSTYNTVTMPDCRVCWVFIVYVYESQHHCGVTFNVILMDIKQPLYYLDAYFKVHSVIVRDITERISQKK